MHATEQRRFCGPTVFWPKDRRTPRIAGEARSAGDRRFPDPWLGLTVLHGLIRDIEAPSLQVVRLISTGPHTAPQASPSHPGVLPRRLPGRRHGTVRPAREAVPAEPKIGACCGIAPTPTSSCPPV